MLFNLMLTWDNLMDYLATVLAAQAGLGLGKAWLLVPDVQS